MLNENLAHKNGFMHVYMYMFYILMNLIGYIGLLDIPVFWFVFWFIFQSIFKMLVLYICICNKNVFTHFLWKSRFRKENLEKLDLNLRAQYSGQAVASWLGFRLQMMGVVMVTGIAFISVLQHQFQAVNAGLWLLVHALYLYDKK